LTTTHILRFTVLPRNRQRVEEGTSEQVSFVRLIVFSPTLETDDFARWYNVPPSPSRLKKLTTMASAGSASTPDASADKEAKQRTDDNSHPLNFDTFIPTHDPSLALPAPPYLHGQVPDYSGYSLPEPPGPMVSQDEAFTRAMSAMYWAGYYSAVYHVSLSLFIPIKDDFSYNSLSVSVTETNIRLGMNTKSKNTKTIRMKNRRKRTRF